MLVSVFLKNNQRIKNLEGNRECYFLKPFILYSYSTKNFLLEKVCSVSANQNNNRL
jgi:hypothetical protein